MSQELSFLSVVHFLAIFASLLDGCNGKAIANPTKSDDKNGQLIRGSFGKDILLIK